MDAVRYSLDVLGDLEGIPIVYTSLARTDTIQTEIEFAAFRALLEPYQKRQWIWALDCRGMSAKQLLNTAFIKRIGGLIEADHTKSLRAVWILNPNTWIRTVLSLFGTNGKATLLPTERLELFVSLHKAGCAHTLIDRFLQLTASSTLGC